MKNYYTYILASYNKVLYVGITNSLDRRVLEHKFKTNEGFSNKYNCNKLVYFEEFHDIKQAIECEKKLKNWHRQWKINLIEQNNPNWEDLFAI